MTRTIRIRNVPDEVYRRLKIQAAHENRSLSDYLLEEIRRLAGQPTLPELRVRLAARTPVKVDIPPAQAVRLERDGG